MSKKAGRSFAAKGARSLSDREKAYALRDAGRFQEAFDLFAKLYEKLPPDPMLGLDFGHVCMEVERFDVATRVFAKVLETQPKNIVALSNLGGSLIRVGRLQDARSILEYVLELDPKNLHARINLGGVLQAAGEREANLKNALEAIAIEPTATLAFNNLGAAFSDMAMFHEAKHAYETAVLLDSKNVDALVNLAATEARLGNASTSAEKYERVLKMLPKEAKHRADAIRFYASFEYLKQGVLEKGWDYYEGGFSPLVPATGARAPRREFSVPRWDGEMLNGKTLLVWREQGLGDELLFATCLHELAALGGQIVVECDARLVETFTRSFPGYRVRAEAFLPPAGNISPNNDFDLHVPMGSLMKYFRRDKQRFTRSGAYVVAHSPYVENFRQRLAPYQANTRLVGICWRSGKLDPVRNLGYTTIDEWVPLLQMPGYTFVNLQYGECEAELQAIEQKLNIKILRWPDLNLKNDLDRTFALMHCLDVVVSVQTAVLTMAGSAGIPVVGVKAGGWTCLGNEISPWWGGRRFRYSEIHGLKSIIEEIIVESHISSRTWNRTISSSRDLDIPDDHKDRNRVERNNDLREMIRELIDELENPKSKRRGLALKVLSKALKVEGDLLIEATEKIKNLVNNDSHDQEFLEGAAIYFAGLPELCRSKNLPLITDDFCSHTKDPKNSEAVLWLRRGNIVDASVWCESAWTNFCFGDVTLSKALATELFARNCDLGPNAPKISRILAETGSLDLAISLANRNSQFEGRTRWGCYEQLGEYMLGESNWEDALTFFERDLSLGNSNYSCLIRYFCLLGRIFDNAYALKLYSNLNSERLISENALRLKLIEFNSDKLGLQGIDAEIDASHRDESVLLDMTLLRVLLYELTGEIVLSERLLGQLNSADPRFDEAVSLSWLVRRSISKANEFTEEHKVSSPSQGVSYLAMITRLAQKGADVTTNDIGLLYNDKSWFNRNALYWCGLVARGSSERMYQKFKAMDYERRRLIDVGICRLVELNY